MVLFTSNPTNLSSGHLPLHFWFVIYPTTSITYSNWLYQRSYDIPRLLFHLTNRNISFNVNHPSVSTRVRSWHLKLVQMVTTVNQGVRINLSAKVSSWCSSVKIPSENIIQYHQNLCTWWTWIVFILKADYRESQGSNWTKRFLVHWCLHELVSLHDNYDNITGFRSKIQFWCDHR